MQENHIPSAMDVEIAMILQKLNLEQIEYFKKQIDCYRKENLANMVAFQTIEKTVNQSTKAANDSAII